jgi:hypothetical protein
MDNTLLVNKARPRKKGKLNSEGKEKTVKRRI